MADCITGACDMEHGADDNDAVSCSAEKLFVLGHPVSHSKSPAMYNAVYGHLGLPWHYDFMDLENEEDARAFLAGRDFLSINVTTPYKPHALEAADTADLAAVLASGANLLVKTERGVAAYNTDGQGCVMYLEREGANFAGAQVVVCGTGPTALAILHAIAERGAARVMLAGRSGSRSRSVLDDYLAARAHAGARQGDDATTAFGAGSYDELAGDIVAANVVVDATSLGMKAGDPAPFDTALLHEGQMVFDVVYGHGETSLVAGARAAGACVRTGGGMLVGQAVATAQIVLDAAGVRHGLSSDDLFSLMAEAAGFDL